MSLLQSVILGILGGLTEFLPVSASGHMVLARAVLHIPRGNDISFEVFTHCGALLSLLVVFRSDLMRLLLSSLEAVRQPFRIGTLYRTSSMFRFFCYIIIGCIPIGIVGLKFQSQIEGIFEDVKLVSDLLLITGFILFLTKFVQPATGKQVTLLSSVIIGCMQAFALMPGISRTGITIGTGLMLNVSQEQAARFSLLMALPVIIAAAALQTARFCNQHPAPLQLQTLIAGTAAACLSGYFALRLLLGVLRRGKFSNFSYYCFAVGVLGILFIE